MSVSALRWADALVLTTKKLIRKIIKEVRWFSHLSVMANLLCFECIAAGYLVNRCFFFTPCNIYIIDLLTRAHLTLAAELPCLCLTSELASLSSWFFVRRHFILLACVATNSSI